MSDDQEEIRLGPIRRHPQVCRGELTFGGSRVWVDALFGYLKDGAPLDEWLEDFPSVSRGQAQATLELALEVLETISAEPELREAVWRADLDLAALMDEDWPHDSQDLRVDLSTWSDALQRHMRVPPHTLVVLANLAYAVDSTVPIENMPDDVAGWLYRAERLVAEIVGETSWDDAMRALSIPERSRLALLAYFARVPVDEEVPARFARLDPLREQAADPNFMKHSMEDMTRVEGDRPDPVGEDADGMDLRSSGRDEIPAWRPLIDVAERACAAAGTRLSAKTVYEDLSLMPMGGASPELSALLDRLEAAANAIDPVSGAIRSTDDHAGDEAFGTEDT